MSIHATLATVNNASPFPRLGPPFDEYLSLLLAADAAQQHDRQVRCFGTRQQIETAILDREEAEAALYQFKHHHATWLLNCIRFAHQLFPGTLQEAFDTKLREELDRTQRAVVELEYRTDGLEARP